MSQSLSYTMQTAPGVFMFSDLNSYSAYVAENLPDDVATMLVAYYAILSQLADKYNATVLDSAGDGVALLFREEDAVNRSFDMAEEVNQLISEHKAISTQATITLDYGQITSVNSQLTGKLKTFCFGTTLNRVGRMTPLQSRLGVTIMTTQEYLKELSSERKSQLRFFKEIAFRGIPAITSLYYK